MKIQKSKYPLTRDEASGRKGFDYYEEQMEKESFEDNEMEQESSNQTFLAIPNDLVPMIEKMIERYKVSHSH